LISSILSRLLLAYSKKSIFKALLWSIAYAGISTFILNSFTGVAGESPVWIPAGIGLGVLLTLGRRYWPFIFVAAVVGEMGGGHEWLMATQLAFGSVCGFLVAATILKRFTVFNPNLESLGDYLRLLLASVIAALISTSLNIQFLIWGGLMPLDNLDSVYGRLLWNGFCCTSAINFEWNLAKVLDQEKIYCFESVLNGYFYFRAGSIFWMV